jgi:hypothetical protein
MIGRSAWDMFPEVRGTIAEREVARALEYDVPIKFQIYFPPAKKWYCTDGYPSPQGVILIFREIKEPSAT